MKIKIIVILGFILTLNLSFSQDSLTLEKCLSIAFNHNLIIQNQKNKQDLAKLNIKKAEDARLPTANGYIGRTTNWGRGIDPLTNTYVNRQFNNYNGGVSVDLNLFNGGYHIHNIKVQKQDLESNKSEWQKIKNDLTIDIVSKFTNILYLQEVIGLIKDQIVFSQTSIDFTQKKIDFGAIAKREIYKVIAQKENEELNLIRAENDLELNKLDLKQLIGMDIYKPIYLLDFKSENLSSLNISEFVTKSISTSPSLNFQKINIEKSKTNLKLAKSGFYPRLSLGGQLGTAYSSANPFFSFGEQVDNNHSYQLSVNGSIPIFNQFQTKNKVKEAKYMITSSELLMETEKQNLFKVLNKTFLDLKASEKKNQVSKSSLNSNQINYDTEKFKYEAGRINIQDLNIAKSNLFNSITSYAKDKYEYIFNTMVYKIYEGSFMPNLILK